MRSLRLRLAVSVIAVSVALIGALAGLLYAEVSRTIRSDFDRQLIEDGHVLSDLVEYEGHGRLDLELGPIVSSFDRRLSSKTWFRLWTADAHMLAGDPGADWVGAPPTTHTPRFTDATRGDGTEVRIVAWRFEPMVDEEDAGPGAEAPVLALAVARDAGQVDELLEGLARLFWLLGTLTCLLVGGVAAWQVSRGIAPVRRLGAELELLSPDEMGRAFDASALPAELVPFVNRLNAMLNRIQKALDREREFTGHVAHELRTPLTVLRTGVELAMRKEAPGTEAHTRLDDMLRTVGEMGQLVDNLLASARLEGGAEALALQRVEVRALVEEAWRAREATARRRSLTFHNRVDADHAANADPAALRIVIRNLIDNAVSYTQRGGTIVVGADPGEVVSVWDSGPQLPASQIHRVFDRLWRSDTARTDAALHAGLGLSLARGLCQRMRLELNVENVDTGGLRFYITTTGSGASMRRMTTH